MAKITYTIEFNEKEQILRQGMAHLKSEEFIVITNHGNAEQYKLFRSFLMRNETANLLGKSKIYYRNSDVLEAWQELNGFLKNLDTYKLGVFKK